MIRKSQTSIVKARHTSVPVPVPPVENVHVAAIEVEIAAGAVDVPVVEGVDVVDAVAAGVVEAEVAIAVVGMADTVEAEEADTKLFSRRTAYYPDNTDKRIRAKSCNARLRLFRFLRGKSNSAEEFSWRVQEMLGERAPRAKKTRCCATGIPLRPTKVSSIRPNVVS